MRFGRAILGMAALAWVASTGCADDDPVAYSESIPLKMDGIKKSDVEKNDEASVEKNVNTETGNPYADFLAAARSSLENKDPSAIEVQSAWIRMRSDTKGVSGVEEVLASVEVFIVGDKTTTIPIGSVDAPTGTEVEVPITADAEKLEPLQEDLKAGSFKVGLRGPAQDPLPANDFDLRLNIDIRFQALP